MSAWSSRTCFSARLSCRGVETFPSCTVPLNADFNTRLIWRGFCSSPPACFIWMNDATVAYASCGSLRLGPFFGGDKPASLLSTRRMIESEVRRLAPCGSSLLYLFAIAFAPPSPRTRGPEISFW